MIRIHGLLCDGLNKISWENALFSFEFTGPPFPVLGQHLNDVTLFEGQLVILLAGVGEEGADLLGCGGIGRGRWFSLLRGWRGSGGWCGGLGLIDLDEGGREPAHLALLPGLGKFKMKSSTASRLNHVILAHLLDLSLPPPGVSLLPDDDQLALGEGQLLLARSHVRRNHLSDRGLLLAPVRLENDGKLV